MTGTGDTWRLKVTLSSNYSGTVQFRVWQNTGNPPSDAIPWVNASMSGRTFTAAPSDSLLPADQRPEVREIWDGALEMLRENFPGIQAVPSSGSSDWAQRRLTLRRPGQRGATAALQLSAEFHPGAVSVIFFPNAVGAALPEFVQLRQELPYTTWPANNPRSQDGIIEIQFPFNSLAEWQTRQHQLAAVTRSVYQAFNPEYHPDEDTDDIEDNE